MIHEIFRKAALTLVGIAAVAGMQAQTQKIDKHIYVYKDSVVQFRALQSEADSVALEQGKSVVSIYNHANPSAPLFTTNYADIDSISFKGPKPLADLLDIKFDEAGNCWDASPSTRLVVPLSGTTAEVDYNKTYDTWEAHFYSNTYAGVPANTCFKVDYSIDDAFKEALSDGHSMECLFKVDYTGTLPNAENKWFSAMEGGGTGFLICTKNRGKNGGNEITFLPNVTPNGNSNWIWCTSGVVPEAGKYYHVVGVWNKEEGKAYIYVNGQLMNEVPAAGDLRLPPNKLAQWVGIGCDANTSTGGPAADSHIAIARIYDKPLTASEVDALWEEVAEKSQLPVADILDVKFNADGTAEDISPMKNKVEVVSENGKLDTYYNAPFGTYAAKINNPYASPAANTKTYAKVDFENNQAFRDALADGHTIETVFKTTYTGALPNAEAKWFSAMQAGGTGFLICRTGNGKDGGNEITFLPNVSTNGGSHWNWATSGVVPKSEHYYHVVGVWNKEEGKAYVYVNGELKNTVDAVGDLHFASAGANWFGIGCDASPSGGEASGNWEIVNARVYDKPLTEGQVENIWNNIAGALANADDSVAKHQVNPADTVTAEAPKADLLDVEFAANGTATDASVSAHTPQWITTSGDEGPIVYYNSDLGRYVARFDNAWGGTAYNYLEGYDYENDQAFKDAVADGHTLEALVMQDYSNSIPTSEAKPFSSHQGGGVGLMVKNGKLCYLPFTAGAYRWALSDIAPIKGKYYHMVGVYSKATGKARLFVNGVLVSEGDAPGDFGFASAGCQRFTIGGDPDGSATRGGNGWIGDVAYARVYSDTLSSGQVRALYKEVTDAQAAAPKFVSDVSYTSGLASKAGVTFAITGKGFKAGDKIDIVPGNKGLDDKISVDATLTADGVSIKLPDGLVNGNHYYLYVERDGKVQTLGPCSFYVVDEMPAGSKVIAHRGYWNTTGSAQNSVASLKKAIEIGCYGSETDVWMTTDGHVMVNHDASYNGVTIKDATYDQCKDLTLANGEKMPELKDLLNVIAAENWTSDTTKLIIEIKDHGDDELNKNAAQAAYDAVTGVETDADMLQRVEFISFSLTACQALVQIDQSLKVAYLSGDKTPQELSDLGIMGLDYTLATYTGNPTWNDDAHGLGMFTNVWTIDSSSEILKCNNMGIDFITTNNPEEALKYQKYFQNLSK